MKAMILAAGLGERMRPLTDVTPKPLLKVGGIPLIVWHLERLAHDDFTEVVINIAHLGYLFPQTLGDGSESGVNIIYSDEQEEGGLESAGGIIKALPLLGEETFLVLNGDIWTDYDFQANRKLADGILAHLILVPNPEHNPEGDFALDGNHVVDVKQYTFSGIGYYSPKLFEGVPYGKSALAPLLRAAMKEGRVTGELYEGEWLDIGTPQRLEQLNAQLLNRY
ncbi:MAG TPA: nucleotidyltransferase family protein [Sulfurovum sp.]|jgi:MurNAc alpha-1-phosphate uridylyltransferase|nr:MAG: mannose-1-phosphate guanylyltransferase [Sulfurovum sp. 35-42-20]OYY56141.1 MAG: mannose-1-phosphate guanylyltransferase [Sulfurovum sp. 28-43-6]OYZ25180.1 MAG: mannose-1-phosphate guanylyltransferase [Sulfurovum sp. 16-42-52]OYZ48618.1 MAG: mannose-1-phosphate guanylyltransferase [Sulfurovum sp. 24-42-9]OZA45338.1 MAG: mannose-1-phosphate guanylyltransferase [Sulfurovum sp. 17-42-90]OZA61025.1 MAG: mannose-1-phosphate guanylyltransferase [Sulfurovum sp. 39-42-12]HQR74382.1 nucleotidy